MKLLKFSPILFFILLIGNIGAAEQSTTSAGFVHAMIFAVVNLVLFAGSVYLLEMTDKD